MIGASTLPTVITQEGGYLTPQLGGNLAAFLTGLSAVKIKARPKGRALRILSDHR